MADAVLTSTDAPGNGAFDLLTTVGKALFGSAKLVGIQCPRALP